MKKIGAFLLAGLLLFLCACGKKDKAPTTQATPNTVTVMFPEGKTVYQIAALLQENGVCSADDFIQAVNESDSAFALPLRGRTRAFLLEGYVFPDTYEFYKNESAANALNRFLSNMDRKFTDAYKARAAELGMTMDEVLTLASIIQTEAGIHSEMKTVSSVLHNRLDSGMRLQCDVTYYYLERTVMPYLCPDGWEDDVYETYAPLYYTYRFAGLPEGPICNPGVAAIEAALYPEDTEYLYFVTDKDGAFHYSATFAEHEKVCAAIQNAEG